MCRGLTKISSALSCRSCSAAACSTMTMRARRCVKILACGSRWLAQDDALAHVDITEGQVHLHAPGKQSHGVCSSVGGDISKGFYKWGIWEFESCQVSRPLAQPEIV